MNKAAAPQLLQRHGIEPDSAAALFITAGDNPDRMHSEAAFAALCGVSPIEASSGKTRRCRLNRGGDRRANSALYHIALTRARGDQRTATAVRFSAASLAVGSGLHASHGDQQDTTYLRICLAAESGLVSLYCLAVRAQRALRSACTRRWRPGTSSCAFKRM